MERAVFLDRDNTLIANDGDLGDPEAVRLLPGVASGLKALRQAGYRLIVVTNQGGVARGVFSESEVDAVHQRIAAMVDDEAGTPRVIDRFYYCPYHPKAKVDTYRRDHPWRKPHPGMILQAARDLELDIAQSWLIGDQDRDIDAGRAAGCRTVLLRKPEKKKKPQPKSKKKSPDGGIAVAEAPPQSPPRPTTTVDTFAKAAQYVLQHTPADTATEEPVPAKRAPHNGQAPPTPQAASIEAPRVVAAPNDSFEALRRSISDLSEELRSIRQKRSEFTASRMAALLLQLGVLLLVMLGLLQLGTTDVFLKWMVGAALLQMMTIALLLLDRN